MVQTFPLPCPCGQTVAVTAAQAGRAVACGCGSSLTVPTLGALRQLAPVASERELVSDSAWSPLRGMLFSGGVVLLLASLALAGYGVYKTGGIRLPDRGSVITKRSEDELRSLQPAEIYEIWQVVRKVNLSATQHPAMLKARAQHREWQRLSLVGLSGAVLGAVCLFGSMIGNRPGVHHQSRQR